MLNKIKTILGITDTSKDTLLQVLIDQATSDILLYCHISTLPTTAEPICIDLVIRKFNLLGTEGLNNESYSGVSFNYATDLPEDIKNKLNAFRLIRMA